MLPVKVMRNLLLFGAVAIVLFHSLIGLKTLSNAAPIDDLSLGSAGGYSLLAGSALTKGDVSSISGDLLSNAGIFPGTIAPDLAALFVTTGAAAFDNGTSPAGLAQVDLLSAISAVQALVPTRETPLLSNEVLVPGIYAAPAGTALGVTIGLVLDGGGDPNSRFIFRTDSALDIAASVNITLINGAQERNVFWEVGTAVTIGANALVVGNFLVTSAATVGADSVIRGSMLCQGAVTIGANSSIIFDALLAPPASPTPSPTDSPTPSASPSASPLVTPTPTASPTPSPTDSPTPSASPSASPLVTPTPTASPSAAPSATPSATPSETPRETPSPTPTPQSPPAPPPPPLPVVIFVPAPVPSPVLQPSPLPSPVESFTPLPTPTPSPSPEVSLSVELSPAPTPTHINIATPSPSPSIPPRISLVPKLSNQIYPVRTGSLLPSGTKTITPSATYFDITPQNVIGGPAGNGIHIALHNVEIGSEILITLQRVNNG